MINEEYSQIAFEMLRTSGFECLREDVEVDFELNAGVVKCSLCIRKENRKYSTSMRLSETAFIDLIYIFNDSPIHIKSLVEMFQNRYQTNLNSEGVYESATIPFRWRDLNSFDRFVNEAFLGSRITNNRCQFKEDGKANWLKEGF